VVDLLHIRPHVLLQELRAGLRDHALLLVELLGNEDVLRCAFADQEFAALKGFFGFDCHDC
jgi:hypothetical protein